MAKKKTQDANAIVTQMDIEKAVNLARPKIKKYGFDLKLVKIAEGKYEISISRPKLELFCARPFYKVTVSDTDTIGDLNTKLYTLESACDGVKKYYDKHLMTVEARIQELIAVVANAESNMKIWIDEEIGNKYNLPFSVKDPSYEACSIEIEKDENWYYTITIFDYLKIKVTKNLIGKTDSKTFANMIDAVINESKSIENMEGATYRLAFAKSLKFVKYFYLADNIDISKYPTDFKIACDGIKYRLDGNKIVCESICVMALNDDNKSAIIRNRKDFDSSNPSEAYEFIIATFDKWLEESKKLMPPPKEKKKKSTDGKKKKKSPEDKKPDGIYPEDVAHGILKLLFDDFALMMENIKFDYDHELIERILWGNDDNGVIITFKDNTDLHVYIDDRTDNVYPFNKCIRAGVIRGRKTYLQKIFTFSDYKEFLGDVADIIKRQECSDNTKALARIDQKGIFGLFVEGGI